MILRERGARPARLGLVLDTCRPAMVRWARRRVARVVQMRRRPPTAPLRAVVMALLAAACRPTGPIAPWAGEVTTLHGEHAEVRTLNAGYDRIHSHVLVREIDLPTLANLDYAAYHANFMIQDEPPESTSTAPQGAGVAAASLRDPFAGALDNTTLNGDLRRTPLTTPEQRHPLAFAPLLEFALSHKVEGANVLDDLSAAVRGEHWGLPAQPGTASQSIAAAYLHRNAAGATELWVKIEFAPWFHGLGPLPDQDGDGVPELYARSAKNPLAAPLSTLIESEYAGKVLDASQIKAWANQLASYWYPSFNTDLVQVPARWPDDQTEAGIRTELAGKTFSDPSVIMRGKPQGEPTYAVFIVKAPSAAAAHDSAPPTAALALPKTKPTPRPELTATRIEQELAAFGQASWSGWNQRVAPFQTAVKKKLQSQPAKLKGLPGRDGFLFYRTSLESILGADISGQPAGKNPLPVIVEFKQLLAAHGVDFLFVPVPSKVEIVPDELDPAGEPLVGHVVNPGLRRFLLELSQQGVEVVDLLTPLLAARTEAAAADQEPLYQHQDTHWTDRGLRLVADVLSARVRQYPWYSALTSHAQRYAVSDATFTRFGDLHARLSDAQKKKYQPETLRAQRVTRADGSFYEDDPDSPITVLGDSFTGVYELTDAEHAGLSAHVARGISYPVDLVMSYGGGPNVRVKLMRRGEQALDHKKLVIWVMAARDLYNYWEDWQPLKQP